MKKIIKIKTPTKNYNIVVQNKSILSTILNEKKNGQKIYIIIDSKVSYLLKNLKKKQKYTYIKNNGG